MKLRIQLNCITFIISILIGVVKVSAGESSVTDGELVRNGSFQQGATGWALSNTMTYVSQDTGKDGPGLQLWPETSLNNSALSYQEIYPLKQATQAVLRFDYRFNEQSGAQFGGFMARLAQSDQGIAVLLQITTANYPGTQWQHAEIPLTSEVLGSLNTLALEGKRVFLSFDLSAYLLTAFVDNVSLKATGTRETPDIPGKVVYVQGEQLKVMSTDGTNDQLVFQAEVQNNSIWHPKWSPDGSEIAFISGHETAFSRFPYDVYGIKPDGSDLHRKTNAPGYAEIKRENYPTGSVTGSVTNDDTQEQRTVTIIIQGAPIGSTVTVAPLQTQEWRVDNVPDMGEGVLQFVTARDGLYSWPVIMTVDVLAGQTMNAGTISVNSRENNYGISSVTWKRDSQTLGLGSMQSAILSIARAGGLEQVLLPGVLAMQPAWSPVNNDLLYASSVGGIWKFDPDTDANPVKSADRGKQPAWSPDGSGFLLVDMDCNKIQSAGGSNCADDVYYRDLTTQQTTRLTDLINESAANPCFTSDGQYILYERMDKAPLSEAPLQWTVRRDIWIMKKDNPARSWQLTDSGDSGYPDYSNKLASATPTPTQIPSVTQTPQPTQTAQPTLTPEPSQTPQATVSPRPSLSAEDCDFNGDGKVDGKDLEQFILLWN